MSHASSREVEVKLRVDDLAAIQARIAAAGAQLHRPRTFESNQILDTPGQSLRRGGELIRIRSAGGECVLTYKGRGEDGKHKSREELEVRASDAACLQEIFARLGYEPSFRYDKYRTEYTLGEGVITIDETPIGLFLELEGPPAWIDCTASALSFDESAYLTASYAELYRDHCRARQVPLGDMVFSGAPLPPSAP